MRSISLGHADLRERALVLAEPDQHFVVVDGAAAEIEHRLVGQPERLAADRLPSAPASFRA